MKKFEFLKKAIEFECYKSKAWMIRAFAIVQDDPELYKSDAFAYRIMQTPTGIFFNTEKEPGELERIEDAIPGQPLFHFKEKLTIDKTWSINVGDDAIETTVGNLMFNLISVVYAFGNKVNYIQGKADVGKIEDIVAKRLVDNVEDSSQEKNDVIYVHEYLRFIDSLSYLEGLAQLCAWAATEKTMLPPTGINEFKQTLLKKYEGKLTDPVELANFEAELKNFDDQYLKDDPTYGAFTSGKIKNMARKKMFLSLGAEAGFTETLDVVPVVNSLEEGWPTEPQQFTAMMNTSRAGSFSRGAETVKGGVSAKVLLRAAGNMKIIDEDCGTELGIHRLMDSSNYHQLVGREVRLKNSWVVVKNLEEAEHLMGDPLIVRSPMYCKLDGDNLCSHCAGQRLAENKEGLSTALTEISSTIMTALLKAMHGKVLSTAKLDYKKAFS